MVRKPTVISLFSGCGGSSLGYKWAGYRELLVIDFDKKAVETFRLNFPDVLCWQKDVRDVTGCEILEACRIKKGELDLLDASPPCQGFSTAGKRKVSDPRNDLFREFIRLIEELKPKLFIMENVAGLARGVMRGRFNEIMHDLRTAGYIVKCRLMNAKWYGVPQSRLRVIWIGSRNDLGTIPVFPVSGKKVIPVKQVLEGLPPGKAGNHKPQIFEAWRRCRPNESLRKAEIRGDGRKDSYVGSFHSCRLDPNEASPTLTRSHTHWHYRIPRKLTPVELKRICSFPDEFRFARGKGIPGYQMGDAVMPKFMEAIARAVKNEVLDHAPS